MPWVENGDTDRERRKKKKRTAAAAAAGRSVPARDMRERARVYTEIVTSRANPLNMGAHSIS